MAITIFPKKIQSVWEVWNLRGAVLASLFCQILLIFCASLRKRRASHVIYIVVWSAYLLADWVAAFAVGLISSTQGEKCEKVPVNDALAAFWAPFLLLHLGGPDTITAFSLEDNELWIRHMLGLIVQLLAVAYVFSQSIPNDFWLPTVLVFFAGSIKYAERTRALYLACLGTFKNSMRPGLYTGPSYAQLMEEYTSERAAHMPTYIHGVSESEQIARAFEVMYLGEHIEMDETQIIKFGYRFFSIFKGLIADQPFNLFECKDSRNIFLSLKPWEAFRVMEVELNFLFDVLFTKMGVVHKAIGYIFHFTCTALIVAAFLLFTMHDKHNIHGFDIGVTRALLVCAICLDFISLIKLIFSDWTIALLERRNEFVIKIHRRISSRNRWSRNMYQHSFINYCLKNQSGLLEIADKFGFKETLEEVLYKREKKVTKELVNFIFNELKDKALQAKDAIVAKKISSARGKWTLRNINKACNIPPSIISSVSKNIVYGQCVLTWHIATELCFFTAYQTNDKYYMLCKLLSDYLFYLLTMRPEMMSSVAGVAQIKIQNTCEEVRRLFSGSGSKLKAKELCQKLLGVTEVFKPVDVEKDRSKSMLFDACTLAGELNTLHDHKWEIMSKVWLELLCYGASHCRGDAHAQKLSKGGELVTFVWLLMAHFGLGDHFKLESTHFPVMLTAEK